MTYFQHSLHQVEVKGKHTRHSGKLTSDQSLFHGTVHPVDRKNGFSPPVCSKRLWRHVDGLQRGFNTIG